VNTPDPHAALWSSVAAAAEAVSVSGNPEDAAAFCAAIDRLSDAIMCDNPIDMVLHCPQCHTQHIDAPEPGQLISGGPSAGRVRPGWDNPPHRSHLCHHCHTIWRPADVPTNGVPSVKTRGKRDNWSPT
jgi:hypothetical protein